MVGWRSCVTYVHMYVGHGVCVLSLCVCVCCVSVSVSVSLCALGSDVHLFMCISVWQIHCTSRGSKAEDACLKVGMHESIPTYLPLSILILHFFVVVSPLNPT